MVFIAHSLTLCIVLEAFIVSGFRLPVQRIKECSIQRLSRPHRRVFQMTTKNNQESNEEEQYPMNPLDVYPSSMADEEVLDALRKERMVSNDIWQSTLFRDTHCGNWVGSYEAYIPVFKEGGNEHNLKMVCSGSINSTWSASEFNPTSGVDISFMEDSTCTCAKVNELKRQLNPLSLQMTASKIYSTGFRLMNGNQVRTQSRHS